MLGSLLLIERIQLRSHFSLVAMCERNPASGWDHGNLFYICRYCMLKLTEFVCSVYVVFHLSSNNYCWEN